MTTTISASALTFYKTTFTIVNHTDGVIWLRGSQIATALGMANASHLSELYKRNLGEFTESMTALVKMDTPGGPQDVRIYTLRGAHLLGMLSRTDRAAEFRRWVLDVLEQQRRPALPAPDEQLGRVLAERDALRTALLAQNPEYQQVLKYHRIEGLTQLEKARLMGWSSTQTWREALKKLAALHLVDYTPDPRAGAKLLTAYHARRRVAKAGTAAATAAAEVPHA